MIVAYQPAEDWQLPETPGMDQQACRQAAIAWDLSALESIGFKLRTVEVVLKITSENRHERDYPQWATTTSTSTKTYWLGYSGTVEGSTPLLEGVKNMLHGRLIVGMRPR